MWKSAESCGERPAAPVPQCPLLVFPQIRVSACPRGFRVRVDPSSWSCQLQGALLGMEFPFGMLGSSFPVLVLAGLQLLRVPSVSPLCPCSVPAVCSELQLGLGSRGCDCHCPQDHGAVTALGTWGWDCHCPEDHGFVTVTALRIMGV